MLPDQEIRLPMTKSVSKVHVTTGGRNGDVEEEVYSSLTFTPGSTDGNQDLCRIQRTINT